jgi:hypothetical protein
LTIEQQARQTALKPPLDDTRENFLSLYPSIVYTFVDAIPQYSKNTEPHMYAQTLENITNWDTIGGQSIVGMMRENRNQDRLSALGIVLDNNIPDQMPVEQQKILISNEALSTATPVIIQDNITITPQSDGNIDIDTGDYIITNPAYGNGPLDIGDAIVPGSFAGSPYANLIPPNLNAWYSSSTLMPSTYTVNEAIEEVVRCNCDCWNLA